MRPGSLRDPIYNRGPSIRKEQNIASLNEVCKGPRQASSPFCKPASRNTGVVGAVESRSALEREWRGSCSIRESDEDCTNAFEGFVHGEGVEAGVVNSSG